tara:strand:+ start:3213 stop:3635 length:423 start_codon:yes stop_codon:yes gene_type:complete
MTGIGVKLFLNSDTAEITIQSTIFGSPASNVDIQSGDVILKIDGKTTKGMGLKEATKLIKGPKDNPIKLILARPNQKGNRKKIEINIKRDTFLIPEEECLNKLNIRELFNYDFRKDLNPIIPQRNYFSESSKNLFFNTQI